MSLFRFTWIQDGNLSKNYMLRGFLKGDPKVLKVEDGVFRGEVS